MRRTCFGWILAGLLAAAFAGAAQAQKPAPSPQILWSAGMETGNLDEFEAKNNSGSADSVAVLAASEGITARSGSWVMKQSVTGAAGGTRMYRFSTINDVYRSGNPIYYSFWAYFPEAITWSQPAGGFFSLLQVQSFSPVGTTAAIEPVWVLGIHPANFTLRLSWWTDLQMSGPHEGESGGRTYDQLVPIPLGQWVFIQTMVTPREDFTGAVKVWMNGLLLFDLANVKTKYPHSTVPPGNESFFISKIAYGQSLTPTPNHHYVDDVTISLGPMPFELDPGGDGRRNDLRIKTLSTRPELVSGGDVLVRIEVPRNVPLQSVRVELNGSDISGIFLPNAAERTLNGLVSGLNPGENILEASISGRRRERSERLVLTNHPLTGPILSAPQQAPFICETETFVLPVTGGTLGSPLDANCSIPTRVDHVYKSTDGTFKPLLDPGVRPADLAQTTTTEGRTVNYIVGVQTGTINRAIYQIAMLHDPLVDPVPDAFTRTPGWNGRLVYSFGGGCNAGYHQGRTTGGAVLAQIGGDAYISRGYAVAASSLNTFANKCDDVVSAETMMMVKEFFIERFGVPRHTIGVGASGGSMQQHLIAHNYPGLLDGILPSLSFADTLTFALPYLDCGLLDAAFNTSALSWTLDQKAAVAGHRTYDYCARNATWWDRFVNPKLQCNPPVRCTLADDMVNVYGRDPQTGFGRRSFDNTGVQYGLAAFNAGRISAEQFLDLNERIGGYDIDGNRVQARMAGDRDAVRIAYRTGRMNSGAAGLLSVPIIDFRSYVDQYGDVHDSVRSYITRARLIAANGHADNQVILIAASLGTLTADLSTPDSPFNFLVAESLRLMDQWLENIANDDSPYHSKAEKVMRNKPGELVDACYPDATTKITDPAACRQMFPPVGNPRLAAGEPLANDRLKCRLKPVQRSNYAAPLTAAQFARLKSIFSDGVCDYDRRGVGQRDARTWLSYPRPGSEDLDLREETD